MSYCLNNVSQYLWKCHTPRARPYCVLFVVSCLRFQQLCTVVQSTRSTNQDGEAMHNQGQTFQATLRLFWDDPVPPKIGSAGAEAEDAYGLRDVMYAR